MAELVRRGVEFVLGSEGASPRELRARAALLSGKYRSGKRDISREHDRYLAQAYKA
jgi:hypothetical protein